LAVVRTFLDDFKAGRLAAIGKLFAPAPRFQWYSTRDPGKRLGNASKDRETLLRYLRSRMSKHERIETLRIGAGYDPNRRLVNFGGKLIRRADDISRAVPQDFKGAADCISGAPRLIVWSM
jgi:hypothetical protein